MIRLPRTWPGIDKASWPALNKIAGLLEKMANSQTDGSIVWNLDEGTMYVPEPQEFEAVILGGTNPYAWAKLRSDELGVWYAMNEEEGSEIGWPEDFAVATVKAASWAGGTVTFTLDQDISVAAGEDVFVAGVQPSEYDGTYTAVTGSGDSFTAALVADPGTYVTGGAVSKASSGNDAFREAYEYNSNAAVPTGAVVWLKPRYLTDGDGTDQEYKFVYCCGGETAIVYPSGTTVTWQSGSYAYWQSGSYAYWQSGSTVSFNYGASWYWGSYTYQIPVAKTVTGTENNWDPGTGTYVQVTPSSSANITGISGGANAAANRMLELHNVSATENLTLSDQSGSSTDSNRLELLVGRPVVVPPKGTACLKYLGTGSSGRWNLQWVSCPCSPGGVNPQTGTTYTVTTSDDGGLITRANSSSMSDTLPQAGTTGFGSGFTTSYQNLGPGTLTVTPTTSTINGESSLAIPPGTGVEIYSDGTNYSANTGGGGGSNPTTQADTVSASSPDGDNTTYTELFDITAPNLLSGYVGVVNTGPTYNLDVRRTTTFADGETTVATATITPGQQNNQNTGAISLTSAATEEFPVVGVKLEVKSNNATFGTTYRARWGYFVG